MLHVNNRAALQPDLRRRLLAELPDATVIAQAPGRVNLIGEHIDYNGFPVLPIAVDRRVWVAAAPRSEFTLCVRNIDAASYPAETIPLDALRTRQPRESWVDYVVAAALARHLSTGCAGVELLVGGDIPPAAGLSSSSAVVVASLLALGPCDDRVKLAERACRAERYVGTLSGGMDQAISLLAEPGRALRIDFDPLRIAPVELPSDLAIVVANSGVVAPKGGSVQHAYNTRVQECSSAAERLGAPAREGVGVKLVDVPLAERLSVPELPDPARRRARFVYAEAARVEAAIDALARHDLTLFGAILDASHAGLRDDYEVSHPEVDRLVGRARAAGALGARIVGAGFGGCIVAACRRGQVSSLLEALGPSAMRLEPCGPAGRVELSTNSAAASPT